MFIAKSLASSTKGEIIGMGSYGDVYIAKETRFNGKVAIKVTSLNETGVNENKSVERNLDKCLKSLKHKNIVKYYGAIEKSDGFYVYMEYVKGNSLFKILKDHGPILNFQMKRYSKQILKGLEYLHGNGIIHRNIKPENILVTFDDDVKLCGFSLSRILAKRVEDSEDVRKNMFSIDSSNLFNFRQSCTMGTPNYQPPEVYNEGKYYFVSDIWSFAVTLVEMVTGNRVTESITDWEKIIRNERKIDLKFWKPLPKDTRIFLNKAFQPDPRLRSSATDLLQCSMFNKKSEISPIIHKKKYL